MKEKQAVTQQLTLRYKRAKKKEKGEILTWLSELTGYHHSYAARVLRQWAGPRAKPAARRGRGKKSGGRPRKYDQAILLALREIWVICDYLFGKRLASYLTEIIPVLERWGEIELEEEVRKRLLEIRPATTDRLLAPEREQFQLRPRAKTKPGTLLRQQIAIRTFSEWEEERPGFVEVDLVAQEGGDPRGDYLQTLDVTDVCTGWTETRAVKNKAQISTL